MPIGSRDTAFWGENMDDLAQNRGVLWRGHRWGMPRRHGDSAHALPLFSEGRGTATVAAIAGYGEVNVRVQCAGQAVSPGDIIIADENGVVVVLLTAAADVLEEDSAAGHGARAAGKAARRRHDRRTD